MGAISHTARQQRPRHVPVRARTRPARPSADLTPNAEARAAGLLLRLLVGPAPHPSEFQSSDWALLLRTARRGRVLVRATDRLAQLGVRIPHRFAGAVADERHRVTAALGLIRRVERALGGAGLGDFLFLKAFRHYPDMAGDLDLLTLAPSDAVTRALTAAVGLGPERGIQSRMAGATTYTAAIAGTDLDVYHGRLGFLGEHTRYPAELLRDRVSITLPAGTFTTSSLEHQLVLQGIQRVYGRRSFKLADPLFTIHALRSETLDWDRVLRAARATGTLPGLSCYLGFVDRIHRRVFGDALLDPAAHPGLEAQHWGPIVAVGGEYRFPSRRVTNGLYRRFLATKLRERDWRAVARVGALLPIASLGGFARGLVRRVRPAE